MRAVDNHTKRCVIVLQASARDTRFANVTRRGIFTITRCTSCIITTCMIRHHHARDGCPPTNERTARGKGTVLISCLPHVVNSAIDHESLSRRSTVTLTITAPRTICTTTSAIDVHERRNREAGLGGSGLTTHRYLRKHNPSSRTPTEIINV